MQIQLSIRDNLEAAEDVFSPSRVESFDSDLIVVGRGTECDCRIRAGEFAVEHFQLVREGDGDVWKVRTNPGTELFINDRAVGAECEVRSGDQLRVGHWIIFIRKFRDPGGDVRSSSRSIHWVVVACVLLLLVELLIMFKLPSMLSGQSLWYQERVRQ